uniref:Uncharacterized protein n=1 Tax=Glossina palpalis gambiensis TaxID=67801 RepID=A0A1B0B288_9MUSC
MRRAQAHLQLIRVDTMYTICGCYYDILTDDATTAEVFSIGGILKGYLIRTFFDCSFYAIDNAPGCKLVDAQSLVSTNSTSILIKFGDKAQIKKQFEPQPDTIAGCPVTATSLTRVSSKLNFSWDLNDSTSTKTPPLAYIVDPKRTLTSSGFRPSKQWAASSRSSFKVLFVSVGEAQSLRSRKVTSTSIRTGERSQAMKHLVPQPDTTADVPVFGTFFVNSM